MGAFLRLFDTAALMTLVGRSRVLAAGGGQCSECFGVRSPTSQQCQPGAEMDVWHWMHSVDRAAYEQEYERYLQLRLDSEAREMQYHAALAPLLQGAAAAPAQDCSMEL